MYGASVRAATATVSGRRCDESVPHRPGEWVRKLAGAIEERPSTSLATGRDAVLPRRRAQPLSEMKPPTTAPYAMWAARLSSGVWGP
jgi:hypothetical protein